MLNFFQIVSVRNRRTLLLRWILTKMCVSVSVCVCVCVCVEIDRERRRRSERRRKGEKRVEEEEHLVCSVNTCQHTSAFSTLY